MDDKGKREVQSRCCACGEEHSFPARSDTLWAKAICESCKDKGCYISGFGDLCQRGLRTFTTAYQLQEAFKAWETAKKAARQAE